MMSCDATHLTPKRNPFMMSKSFSRVFLFFVASQALQLRGAPSQLAISQSGGLVNLSWQDTNNWLQSSTTLGSPSSWVNVPAAPLVAGGNNRLTLSACADRARDNSVARASRLAVLTVLAARCRQISQARCSRCFVTGTSRAEDSGGNSIECLPHSATTPPHEAQSTQLLEGYRTGNRRSRLASDFAFECGCGQPAHFSRPPPNHAPGSGDL